MARPNNPDDLPRVVPLPPPTLRQSLANLRLTTRLGVDRVEVDELADLADQLDRAKLTETEGGRYAA